MPTVSVIIPTYNRNGIVNHAIESALTQSFTDREIIVVDDGSTDGTSHTLREYGERIRCIHQSNSGVSAARNAGVIAATGTWIAFLDSDDEWLPEKLSEQMAAIRRQQDLVAHVTDAWVVLGKDEERSLFAIRGYAPIDAERGVLPRPLKALFDVEFFTPTFIVRRDALLAEGLFDPRMSAHEDKDLFARVALRGPWGVSRRSLVRVYRRGEQGSSLSEITRDQPIYGAECLVRLYTRLLADPRLAEEERGFIQRRLSGSRFLLADAHLASGNRREARRCFVQSFRDDPSLRTIGKCAVGLVIGRCAVALLRRVRSGGRKGFYRDA